MLQKLTLDNYIFHYIYGRWRASRNDGTEQPPRHGSRPPAQLY
jgi:hypothetical protein